MFGALLLATWVKGGVADTDVEDPTSVDDGVVCQVLEADGRRSARCATIVRAPVANVSAAVRDYERFPEMFDSELGSIELGEITREGDGRVHLVGEVSTVFLGTWPMDVHVVHEDLESDRHTASWEETEGSGTYNRGRWVVAPASEGSLLVYELEVQVDWAPTFLVNAVLLTQLSYPLHRVADRVESDG